MGVGGGDGGVGGRVGRGGGGGGGGMDAGSKRVSPDSRQNMLALQELRAPVGCLIIVRRQLL